MIKFYNAGAGAGKTHTLSNELANFLIEGNGKPEACVSPRAIMSIVDELENIPLKLRFGSNYPDLDAICMQLVQVASDIKSQQSHEIIDLRLWPFPVFGREAKQR